MTRSEATDTTIGQAANDPPPNSLHEKDCRWYPWRQDLQRTLYYGGPLGWRCAPNCTANRVAVN